MGVVQLSCSGVYPNVRSEQSNGVVTGGGNLALTAFRSTALSAARQPVTTARLGMAVLWHRPRAVVSGNSPADVPDVPALTESPGSPEFEALLDRKHFPPAEAGSLEWLVDGPGFFPELDRQIASARSSIDIQMFIFDNDDIAVRYADALKLRSSEVSVRVLFDDLGSTFAHSAAPVTVRPHGFVPPPDMHGYLQRQSRIRVRRTLNPWLVCDHTKLLVFDQQTAILGGMNIGREYFSEWHDLMVRVEGPVVGSLSGEFSRAWGKAGQWGEFPVFREPAGALQPAPRAGGIPLRLLRTDSAAGRHEILDVTLLAIRGARRRIWIENPYFAHDEIAAAVAAAARRGVDVRVIIPSRGDSTIMDIGNLATANGLICAGAKVFRYPRMTHMKAMICDDWACVGSANLDTLSLHINRELNLAFSHAAAVSGLAQAVFVPDFHIARPLHPAKTKGISTKLAETIADQL